MVKKSLVGGEAVSFQGQAMPNLAGKLQAVGQTPIGNCLLTFVYKENMSFYFSQFLFIWENRENTYTTDQRTQGGVNRQGRDKLIDKIAARLLNHCKSEMVTLLKH